MIPVRKVVNSMTEKSGYSGKISNKGAQQVKAPYPQGGSGKNTVKTGGDLRSKKTGK